MRKHIRKLILLQQAIIFALAIVLGLALHALRKQQRVIEQIVKAIVELDKRTAPAQEQLEPAEERRADVRTY